MTLSGNGLRGKFTPDEPLAAETSYTLMITKGVADASGDALQAQVEVSFTTYRVVNPGPILFERFWPERNRREIWAVEPDGSHPVAVAEGGDPSWSSDGSKIAFNRDGHLYAMNANGTDAVLLRQNAGSPAWSPDGSGIAYTRGSGMTGEVYVMNADGSDPRNLTSHGALDYQPTWSPDGSRIAFASNRHGEPLEIYVMDADGSNVERLTVLGAKSPAWSPDGSMIAFVGWSGGSEDIYVMNADGTGVVNLTNDPARDRSPVWSPDGGQIVFSSERRQLWPGDPPYDLWAMNADGNDVRPLTATDDYFDWFADWRR